MAGAGRLLTGATQRTIRFFVALTLLIYEAVLYHGGDVRWHLILLYGTMMGLPIAELGDELRRKASSGEDPHDDEA